MALADFTKGHGLYDIGSKPSPAFVLILQRIVVFFHPPSFAPRSAPSPFCGMSRILIIAMSCTIDILRNCRERVDSMFEMTKNSQLSPTI
jgi:hypothetical protein